MNKPGHLPLDLQAFEERLLKMPVDAFMQESKRLQQLVKRSPKNPELQVALAMMHLRTETYREGVKHLKKALKLAPRYEPALKAISEVLLLELTDYKEALGYLKKWALLRPDEARIKVHIAECLLNLEKIGEAHDVLDKAERLAPDSPEIYAMRAEIHTKVGDPDQARASFERALELGDDPQIASRLVTLPGFEADEAQLDRICVIADGKDNLAASTMMYSNLGSAYEKIGKYSKAFGCFLKSNELPSTHLGRKKELAEFKNVRETFTPEFLNLRSANGHDTDRPIFIVGMPRSGTTLTESILAGHPKIIDNGELTFLQGFLRNHGLDSVVNPLLADKLPTLREHFHNAPEGYFKRIAEHYIHESGYKPKVDKYQVDKLPHNFLAVGLISVAFPNATIIHCRRHPVDCGLSCFKSSFLEFHAYATDLEFLGLYYRQYWELMKYWREVLPGKMYEVFYEDTVVNTENVARGMIDHIGLEWDEACLNHTGSKKTVNTVSQWQVRQPIYTSSVAKWKHYESELQPMIRAMGSCVAEYEAELAQLSS